MLDAMRASRSWIALLWLISGIVDLVMVRLLADSNALFWSSFDLRYLDADETSLAVMLLVLSAGFKRALYSPLRRSVYTGTVLGPWEVLKPALWFTIPALVMQQIISIVITGAAILFLALGLQMSFIPQMMLYMSLTPAIYLVVTQRSGILSSFRTSIRLSYNWGVILFGVQLLPLLAGACLGKVFTGTEGLLEVCAAASMYLLLGWLAWQVEVATYLAIDEEA